MKSDYPWAQGENNSRARLKRYQVSQIKSLINMGFMNIEIASVYGVGKSTINHIKYGRTWPDVMADPNARVK